MRCATDTPAARDRRLNATDESLWNYLETGGRKAEMPWLASA